MYCKPLSAFVHQLTPAEAQRYNYDILCDGAAYNIKLNNKEDAYMIEKLFMYLNELEVKRNEVLATDDSAAIEAEVATFRDAVIKRYAVEKDNALAKIDSDIECVKGIIDRETVLTAVPAEDPITE